MSNAPMTLDDDPLMHLMARVDSAADAQAKALTDTVIAPRFYTTDYQAMDRLDVTPVSRRSWRY